jgi:hypothetical protein
MMLYRKINNINMSVAAWPVASSYATSPYSKRTGDIVDMTLAEQHVRFLPSIFWTGIRVDLQPGKEADD